MAALSQSVPLTRRSGGDSSPCGATLNPYDQRDLQGKAIRNWEKQKRVWSNVEANIQRRILKNSKVRKGCTNMSQGIYKTRLREEELSLVGNAVPSSIFSGVHTWESTLRTSEDGGALRYLKLGRSDFPYPLYVKVTDDARTDPEHLKNTRVVFQNEPPPQNSSTSTSAGVNMNVDGVEDEVSVFGSPGKSSQEALSSMKPVSFGAGNYYEEKIQRYLPILEQRMSHLFLPRAYLEVCGQPPPWTTNIEDAQAANKAAPAVVRISPPPGKSSPTTTSFGNVNMDLSTHKQSQEMKKSRLPSVIDPAMRTVSIEVAPTSEQEVAGELLLEISTTRLLFFASPGELAHGFVKVKNSGMMTVYYTWEPHQPITALDGDLAAEKDDDDNEEHEEEEKKKKDEEDDNEDAKKSESIFRIYRKDEVEELHKSLNNSDHQNYVGELEEKKVTDKQRVPLRLLAKKSAQSKTFFCLSTPFDGVILPGDEEIFPFSVRAPFPGRFTQHYEFLVIPVVSSRIIVELCAIVRDGGPSLEAISRPIANAIDSKAVVDSQRTIINELVANDDPYEAAEIEKATQQQIVVARAPEVAKEVLTSKWREAWHECTYTALRIPFNCAVYARLDALHANLVRTMESLGQPLHHKEWDGSVQTLQADLCTLRDAPSRNILREAFNILLQAASVSEQETEPLDMLLQRIAGTIAFTTLAQRACELDDAIAISIGLHIPQSVPIASALQNTRFGGSGGNMGAPPTATTGSTTSTSLTATPAGRRGVNSAGKPPGRLSGKGKSTVTHDSSAGAGAAVSGRGPFTEEPMASAGSLAAGAGDIATEEAMKGEYNTRFFLGMRRLVGDAVDRVCSMWDSSRAIVEAACGLSLLDTIESARVEDVRVIQAADEMDIDFTVDIVQPKRRK
ncbi:hypothetical protein LSM04_008236 [Trypanosoma melophagium]|uniref:uncharacterized protein n=1 Tax=Trypanosoma melophagium TaxID=715481 RepID=UPI00351A9147|nr:hypothetical protein LSM04_008236 [Trypanosoma melophagium]